MMTDSVILMGQGQCLSFYAFYTLPVFGFGGAIMISPSYFLRLVLLFCLFTHDKYLGTPAARAGLTKYDHYSPLQRVRNDTTPARIQRCK